MNKSHWQHLGHKDQDVNHQLATGEHPDLGLLEGGEEDLLNFFNSGLEVPVPAPV